MRNKNILLKIKKLALRIDWDDAFAGKSKGNRHLFRITKIARFLAQKTGADLFVVEAGALLHDVSLPSGDDSDYEKNKQRIIRLLRPFKLAQPALNNIAECVASHEGRVKPRTLEAKVVHDADVLEKAGILGIVRHAWKLANLEKINPDKINNEVVHSILHHIKWRSKQLQTPLAKRINQHLSTTVDFNQAKKIITKTAKLAQQGIVTEKIAGLLAKELTSMQRNKLKEQISLSYLRGFALTFDKILIN